MLTFQRRSMREEGREAYLFSTERYGCTRSPLLKARQSQVILYTCTDVHTAVALLHFFPALLPVIRAVQKYELHRHLPVHLSCKPFVARCGEKLRCNRISKRKGSQGGKKIVVYVRRSMYYPKVIEKHWQITWAILAYPDFHASWKTAFSLVIMASDLNYQSKTKRHLLKQLLEEMKRRIMKI